MRRETLCFCDAHSYCRFMHVLLFGHQSIIGGSWHQFHFVYIKKMELMHKCLSYAFEARLCTFISAFEICEDFNYVYIDYHMRVGG